jgi:predicted transcriptional regulator
MEQQVFQPGDKSFAAEGSPGGQFSAVFEDDGETGHFYAVDLTRTERMILDAGHIYNAANVLDKDRPSTLEIVWSENGLKCVLLINGFHTEPSILRHSGAFAEPAFPILPIKPKAVGLNRITAGQTTQSRGSRQLGILVLCPHVLRSHKLSTKSHKSWYAEGNPSPQEAGMAETTITIQVDLNLKKAFSEAAEAHNRTDEDLLLEFIQDYVETQRTDTEYEQWFRRQVKIGIDAADAGDLIRADAVETEFATLREAAQRKLPRSA